MTTEAELAFADKAGRLYAQRYSFPPMTGRVLGWLMICDPPQQTIAELSEALRASRSAVTGAVVMLEAMALVRRSRTAGERVDRVDLNPEYSEQGLKPDEYIEQAAIARDGLAVISDASPARRGRLLEYLAFAEFLAEQMPALSAAWVARRAALLESGDIPDF